MPKQDAKVAANNAPSATDPHRHRTTVIGLLTSFIAGGLMGLGLGWGGMLDPRVMSSMFNLLNIERGSWDPTLFILFGTALAVHTLLFHGLVRFGPAAPAFAQRFAYPSAASSRNLTKELFMGSILFGAGWALCCACPGPAVVLATTLHPNALLLVGSIMLGFAVYKFQHAGPGAKQGLAASLVFILASLGLIGYGLSVPLQQALGSPPNIPLAASYSRPVMGGAVIGLAPAFFMWAQGEVLGISGIINGLVNPKATDKIWRLAFLLGLIAAGAYFQRAAPAYLAGVNYMQRPPYLFVLGGLMVGYGTSLGSGCTSGHGICGISRGSPRSISATACFFLANMAISTLMSSSFKIGLGWQGEHHEL